MFLLERRRKSVGERETQLKETEKLKHTAFGKPNWWRSEEKVRGQ